MNYPDITDRRTASGWHFFVFVALLLIVGMQGVSTFCTFSDWRRESAKRARVEAEERQAEKLRKSWDH